MSFVSVFQVLGHRIVYFHRIVYSKFVDFSECLLVSPMSVIQRSSESANAFAHHIHDLHTHIRQRINKSNDDSKISADSHRKLQEFQEGDYVMVRIRPERFSQGSAKKLQARSAGPFKILQKIGSNAYRIDLPSEMGINPTFNVEDLVRSHNPIVDPSSLSWPFSDFSSQPVPPLPPPIVHKEEIEEILDEEIVSTRDGGFQRYLVK